MTKKLVSFDDQAEPGEGLPAAVKTELNATYGTKGEVADVAAGVAAFSGQIPTLVADAIADDDTVALAAAAAAEPAVATALADGLPPVSITTNGLMSPVDKYHLNYSGPLDALVTPGRYYIDGPNVTEANGFPVDLRGVSAYAIVSRTPGNVGIQTIGTSTGATGGRFISYQRRFTGISAGVGTFTAWTRGTVTGEPGGGAVVSPTAPNYAAPVGAEHVQTATLGGAVKWIKRTGTDATGWEQEPILGSRPGGLITWTPMAGLNFAPRSIGVDGLLYFTYLGSLAVRSSDPTLAAREGGPDFSGQMIKNIRYVTRTTAGYIVITSDTATDTGAIWFSPTWTSNMSTWTKVQDTRAFTDISLSKPRVIAGDTWMVAGEYVTGVYPSTPRAAWATFDGGQTWTNIRNTAVNNSTVNAHWHAFAITASGRIWASAGDGINSFFGYTDDRGKSWVPSPLPTGSPLYDGASDFQQPTVILDFGGRLIVCPDRGPFPTGTWRVDPDSGRTVAQHALPSGEIAHTQYGSGSAQRGKEAYISFPDHGSGSARTRIIGTGDGGRSFHPVGEIDTTGGAASGPLVGPDRNGYVWIQPGSGSIPIYGTAIMRGSLPSWSWVD